MRLIVSLLVSIMMVGLAGCAGLSNKVELAQSHMKLLDGSALFGEPVQVSEGIGWTHGIPSDQREAIRPEGGQMRGRDMVSIAQVQR